MNTISWDCLVEISLFLNQDARLVLLGGIKKSWRLASKTIRAKLLSLNNGPMAPLLYNDGSVLCFLKLYIRDRQVVRNLYGDCARMLMEDDWDSDWDDVEDKTTNQKTFDELRSAVAGYDYDLSQKAIATLGRVTFDTMLQGMDTIVEFCNTRGECYEAARETLYVARVERLNEYREKLTPQHCFPPIEVVHSPLSIVPTTDYSKIPGPNRTEEQHIRGWEAGDRRWRAVQGTATQPSALQLWITFAEDLVRFGLRSFGKEFLAMKQLIERLPHPIEHPRSMDSDGTPIRFHHLTHEQAQRALAVLESFKHLKHVAPVLASVRALEGQVSEDHSPDFLVALLRGLTQEWLIVLKPFEHLPHVAPIVASLCTQWHDLSPLPLPP
jgi:hypothetical protein